MKIFKATIEASNSCYVQTVLVIAENKKLAHDQLCKKEKRQVIYKSDLQEIQIDTNNPNVIEIGFGENDSDYSSDD